MGNVLVNLNKMSRLKVIKYFWGIFHGYGDHFWAIARKSPLF